MVAFALKNQKIPVSAQYQTPEMLQVLVDLVEVLVDLINSPVVIDTNFVTMEPDLDLVD